MALEDIFLANPSTAVFEMPSYAQLSTEKAEIRLLNVEKLEDDETVPKVTLSTVSLHDNPRYYALSYVWGKAWLDDGVKVDETTVRCTASLAQILTEYPRLITNILGNDELIPLWIDAICINQQDVQERSAQVQTMKKIYKQVVAWIGPEYQLGLRCLKILAKEIASLPNSSVSLSWLRDLNVDFCRAHYETRVEDGTGNFFWDAINQFLNSPYWTRMWVLQEMTLANKLYFVCGSYIIQDDDIMTVWAWVRDITTQLHRPSFIASSIWVCWVAQSSVFLSWRNAIKSLEIRKLWLQCQQLDVSDVRKDIMFDSKIGGIEAVIDHRWLKSTDPKDKVYGLLGLVNANIIPDYSSSIRDVYINFIHYWIIKKKTLGFLSIAGIGESDRHIKEFDLPSWVPNFAIESAGLLLLESSYTADAGHTEDERSIRIDDGSLFLSGVVMDEISETRKVESFEEFCTYALDIACEHNDINKIAMYPTGITVLQALFRVTVGDADIFTQERSRLHQPGSESFDRLINAFMLFHTIGLREAGPSQGLMSNLPYIDLFLGPGASNHDRHSPPTVAHDPNEYQRWFFKSTYGKRLFWTKEGYLGVGAPGLKAGDCITIAFGYSIPLILRKVGSYFELVGYCFILGYMDGEAVKIRRSRGLAIQEIEIR